MAYDVTLITGDGTGPELAEATRKCVDATGVKINWDVQEAGVDVMERTGNPLPPAVLESVRRNRVALKAPITTPVGTGFRSINVHLRQEFDLFACVRPCKYYPGVRSYFSSVPVDLVIFRENTEDLYSGVEFERGADATKDLIETVNLSVSRSDRLIRAAFQYAVDNNRKKVTVVHKANIMKFSDGLWLETARNVAKDFPQIEFDERIVDNMCMQLVQKPELYDVVALPNLYGDILSDLCAGLVGGLGVAPGANIGYDCAVFEATHGSAPKYKGLNKVNPVALILSAVLMLRHLKETDAADRLENAVAAVIREGKDVTYDLKADRNDPTAVGTQEMADAICRKL